MGKCCQSDLYLPSESAVSTPTVLRAIQVLTLTAVQLSAQSFDPVKQATGWTRADVDGSLAFYDPGRRKVVSWMKGGGELGEVNVSSLPQALWYWEMAQGNMDDDSLLGQNKAPEKWALDASFNAWVITGRYLQFVGKDGKISNVKLPQEVGDLAWDTQGIYLCYRSTEPFIEKRSFDGGNVIWSYRAGSGAERPAPAVQSRIAVTENKLLLLSNPDSFDVDLIDSTTGQKKGKVAFTHKGAAAPNRAPGTRNVGPMAWWLNKNTLLQAAPASQVPALGMVGLLLAKQNLTSGTMTFIPTGLSEQHFFVGVVDSEAVFIAPTGGLVFIPIQPS